MTNSNLKLNWKTRKEFLESRGYKERKEVPNSYVKKEKGCKKYINLSTDYYYLMITKQQIGWLGQIERLEDKFKELEEDFKILTKIKE